MSTDHRHTGHGHRAGSHDYAMPTWPEAVDVFDTTLRDGSQQEGLSLTVDDKLRVAEQLDHLGVAYIEGGWPGANPKDDEFFRRAPTELRLATSTLVAFGSTRRPRAKADGDETLRKLVEADTSTVCIVAKAWDRHVIDALRAELDEGVAMVADSVDYLVRRDKRVFLDAEHFFDGYRHNPEFALRVLRAAEEAGAEALVLCDTNGGNLPARHRRDRARRGRPGGVPGRHPLPQRHRLRGGQHVGGRRRRRHPGPGVHQRLRGAVRQRRPRGRHPGPHAQAVGPHDPTRAHGAPDRGLAPHRRAGEHPAQPPAALRRGVGLHAQGGAPRECRGRGAETSTSTSRRTWSATGCGWWCPRWPDARPWP